MLTINLKIWRLLLAAFLTVTCCHPAAAQNTGDVQPGTDSLLSSPSAAKSSDSSRPALERRGSRYQLCASDAIAITFPLTPEFNQSVNIGPDGFASLSGAGDIHLEGLTTEQSVTAIEAAYAKILHNPIVAVELKDFNKPYFTVSGQVHKPGKFDLRGYTTATEAVAIAGGFNESAKHSQVLLFRRKNDDWYEVRPLDLKRILQGHGVSEDAEIRPGDMLFVPQNFISKIKKFIPSSGMGAYYQMHP